MVVDYDAGWTTSTTVSGGSVCGTLGGTVFIYFTRTELPEPEAGEIPDFLPKIEWDPTPKKINPPSRLVTMAPVFFRRAMISKSGWKPRRMRKRHRGKQ